MLNKSNLLFILILLGLGLVFASGWHLADEIFPGTFAPGVYSFNGSIVNFTGATVIGTSGSMQLETSISTCDSSKYGTLVANQSGNEILFCNGEEWEFFQRVGPFHNWYGDESDGDILVNSSGVYQDLGSGYQLHPGTTGTEWNSNLDGDMIVINAKDFTVESGVIFRPTNRCKGLIIYATGNVTVDGIVTMTARGAAANPSTVGLSSDGNSVPDEGLVIRREKSDWSDVVGSVITNANAAALGDFQGSHNSKDLFFGGGNDIVNAESMQGEVENGLVIKIPKIGASGGAAYTGVYYSTGNAGNSAAFSFGGGGSGGSTGFTSGRGGIATCFSGGSGGGGANQGAGADPATSGGAGSDYGGAGGNGGATNANCLGAGGAGNAGGQAMHGGVLRSYANGQSGTGGLLLIFAKEDIKGLGSFTSEGSKGGEYSATSQVSTGGGSGGGIVGIFYGGSSSSWSGSTSVAGGSKGTIVSASYYTHGGDGGSGSIIGPIKIDK